MLQLRETLGAFVTWGRGCLCDVILVVPVMSDLVASTMGPLSLSVGRFRYVGPLSPQLVAPIT